MNNISISGRLTRDVDLSETVSGAVNARFSVAVQDGKDKTDFFVCVGVCWKYFAVAVQAIYICIALMFAVFGGVMVGRSVWLTKQVKENRK